MQFIAPEMGSGQAEKLQGLPHGSPFQWYYLRAASLTSAEMPPV